MPIPSKRHPWIAALHDLYLVSLIASIPVGATLAVLGLRANPVASFLLLGFVILLTIAYHAAFAFRTRIRSPGELAVGATLVNGEKVWQNPFDKNRWALFLVQLLLLALAGNMWDSVFDGTRVVTVGAVMIKSCWSIAVVIGVTQLGQGNIAWSIGPVAYVVSQGIGFRSYPSDKPEVLESLRAFSWFLFGMAAVYGLVALIYDNQRGQRN